jgi:AraC family transcriptional activator of pyochelin receptor
VWQKYFISHDSIYEKRCFCYDFECLEMSYIIEGSDFEDFFLYDQKTENASACSCEAEKLLIFDTPKGKISYKEEIVQDGLSILSGHYQFDDDVAIYGKGDSSLLELHFNLSNQNILFQSKISETVKPMAGNLMFMAAEDNKATIGFEKDINYDTFDIHLPISMLSPYAGESKAIDEFLNNVDRNVSTNLAKNEINVNAKIFSVIQDIKNCNYERLSRRLYLESKILELLAESFQVIESKNDSQELSNADIERIRFAGQLIRENIAKPLTIVQLARAVGVNHTKLKIGFKAIFGDTVFGYLQTMRMNEAKRYLLDTNLPLQEITHLSGYTNLSNFSIAFKRTFGFPPSRLRLVAS